MVKAHKHLPTIGFCKLCGAHAKLEKSHVHPRLAYKRFASSPNGSPFIDLAELSRHSRQLQRRWFCRCCEKRFEGNGETPTAAWLDRLPALDCKELNYGPFLHYFSISLVYRYALLELEDGTPPAANRKLLAKPMASWRAFLLGSRKQLGVCSVHGVLVPADTENGPWEAALGGQVAYINHLIVTRTGPLVTFGLLSKNNFSRNDAKQWETTELLQCGGQIPVIRKSDNRWATTPEIRQLLDHTDRWCSDRTMTFNSRQNFSN